MSLLTSPVLDRLWPKVDIRGPGDCWPFVGCVGRDGYGRIGRGSRKDGTTNAHVVVAEAYHGPRPQPNYQARHLCGNRACCNPGHLAWGDQSANERDKLAHGRSNRGERHGQSKLTREQVDEIRRRCASGEYQRVVATDYGISQQTVSEIVTRKLWGWL